uniref:Cytochrome P450 92B1 n=1 Tax=Solanum tuberosum TaxID=4113 RepID=M0ZLB7_SOLTU
MTKEILKTHDAIFASSHISCWTVDSFEYIRVEERRTLISHVFSLSGKPVLLKDHLPRFTLRTISRKFYKYVLEEHKAKKEDYVPEDMVDTFLHLADDPNLQVKLTSDRLMGLIHDLVSGATDTSAATIEWAFQELLRKPNIIDKAQQELDRVIGKE